MELPQLITLLINDLLSPLPQVEGPSKPFNPSLTESHVHKLHGTVWNPQRNPFQSARCNLNQAAASAFFPCQLRSPTDSAPVPQQAERLPRNLQKLGSFGFGNNLNPNWVLVEGFDLRCHKKGTILFTIDPYYGNLKNPLTRTQLNS